MVSDELLKYAANHYDFDVATLRELGAFTNQVYSFDKDGKSYILRFSQRPIECLSQTKAEMDWLYYLSNQKISVSLPVATNTNELAISTIIDNENYIISAFNKVNGVDWDKNNPDRWNEKLFFTWGKTMGDIHNCSKNFIPLNDVDKRSNFKGTQGLFDCIKAIPTIKRIAKTVVNEMLQLPIDKNSYGLIHYDLHPYNFLIDGERINVFDFDDSLYGFFALDIGVALYHALWWGLPEDKQEKSSFSSIIIKNFLKGYLSSNHLEDFWLSKIPLFMKFRQICALSWFLDPNDIDSQKEEIYDIENDILIKNCKIDDFLFSL